jgi:hypothetical protein
MRVPGDWVSPLYSIESSHSVSAAHQQTTAPRRLNKKQKQNGWHMNKLNDNRPPPHAALTKNKNKMADSWTNLMTTDHRPTPPEQKTKWHTHEQI